MAKNHVRINTPAGRAALELSSNDAIRKEASTSLRGWPPLATPFFVSDLFEPPAIIIPAAGEGLPSLGSG